MAPGKANWEQRRATGDEAKAVGGGASYEGDELTIELADVRSLRSIFERDSQESTPKRKEATSRRTSVLSDDQIPPSHHTGPDVVDHGGHATVPAQHGTSRRVQQTDERIDCSQPSIEDLLAKFRNLEEKARMEGGQQSRKLKNAIPDEYTKRSASLERGAKLTYDKKTVVPSWSFSSGKQQDGRAHTAGDQRAENGQAGHDRDVVRNEWKKEPNLAQDEYHVSVDSIKATLGLGWTSRAKANDRVQTKSQAKVKDQVKVTDPTEIRDPVMAMDVADGDDAVDELPPDGMVQNLVAQWRSIEGRVRPRKKRVSFGVDPTWNAQQLRVQPQSRKKSCLKTIPSTVKDNSNDVDVTNTQLPDSPRQKNFVNGVNPDQTRNAAADDASFTRNTQNLPPDIVRQIPVNGVGHQEEDELPPQSNTKNLLERFKVLQTHREPERRLPARTKTL